MLKEPSPSNRGRALRQRHVKRILLGGTLTGLGSGLIWSTFINLVSRDQLFNGQEFMVSLTVPFLVGLVVWKSVSIQKWVLILIGYLTLAVPLFGIGIGGANTLQMTFGGAIGGLVWAIPFALYNHVINRGA